MTHVAKSKRRMFAKAIIWIAQNDNAGNNDTPEDVAGYISTCLVCDLFGVPQDEIADHVMKFRKEVMGL